MPFNLFVSSDHSLQKKRKREGDAAESTRHGNPLRAGVSSDHGGTNVVHLDAATATVAARTVVTDMISPARETAAGKLLERNMDVIRNAGCLCTMPRQNISAFDIPDDLKERVTVFVCGSPAYNNRLPDKTSASNITFKQEIFYSLQRETAEHTAVCMTYSAAACPGLEWKSIPKAQRVLMVTPAYFESYRPRRGLAESNDELGHDNGEEPDTMVALYLPLGMANALCWAEDGKLDVARSIVTWLGTDGHLLTFGAHAADLEVDIIAAAPAPASNAGKKTAFKRKLRGNVAAGRIGAGRPYRLDGAALQRLAEIALSLSGRVTLSCLVMRFVLQQEIEKMDLEYKISVAWTREFMKTWA